MLHDPHRRNYKLKPNSGIVALILDGERIASAGAEFVSGFRRDQ